MSRAMIQMICDVTGVIPQEADIFNRPRGSVRNRGSILNNRGVEGDTRVISLGRSSNYSG